MEHLLEEYTNMALLSIDAKCPVPSPEATQLAEPEDSMHALAAATTLFSLHHKAAPSASSTAAPGPALADSAVTTTTSNMSASAEGGPPATPGLAKPRTLRSSTKKQNSSANLVSKPAESSPGGSNHPPSPGPVTPTSPAAAPATPTGATLSSKSATSQKKSNGKSPNSAGTSAGTSANAPKGTRSRRKVAVVKAPSKASIQAAEEAKNEEEEELSLQQQLVPSLQSVSRQKLRSLRMALRKAATSSNASNEASMWNAAKSHSSAAAVSASAPSLSAREVERIVVDLRLPLSNRVLQMLLAECEVKSTTSSLSATALSSVAVGSSTLGGSGTEPVPNVNLEKFMSVLERAQALTGRDSVEALVHNNMGISQSSVQEETDADLQRRAVEQMLHMREGFDLEDMRALMKASDVERKGLISMERAKEICLEQNCPIYGALLHHLLKRSDHANNGHINWPEVVSFLERIQTQLLEDHPEMAQRFLKKQTVVVKALPTREAMRKTLLNAARKARAEESGEASKSNPSDASNKNSRQGTGETVGATKKTSTAARRQPKASTAGPAGLAVGAVPSIKVNNDSRPSTGRSQKKTGQDSSRDGDPNTHEGGDAGGSLAAAEDSGAYGTAQGSGHAGEDAEGANATTETSNPSNSSAYAYTDSVKLKAAIMKPSDRAMQFIQTAGALDLPLQILELQWVYGYRGNDCRHNLVSLPNGEEVVYFVSYLVVIYNTVKHTQKIYKEHSADVKSIALHAEGVTLASAQGFGVVNNSLPCIRLWKSDSLSTICVLGENLFQAPITRMCFNWHKTTVLLGNRADSEKMNTRDLLAALEDSKGNRTLHVWNVQTETRIGSCELSREMICDMGFVANTENQLVSVGKDHIVWWEIFLQTGRVEEKGVADHRGFLKARYTQCLLFTMEGDMITGDSNGTVYVWGAGGKSITNYFKHAHEEPVFSLALFKDFLLTGSRDGRVRAWRMSKNYLDYSGEIQLPEVEGGVRTLSVLPSGALVIGTTSNSLLLCNMNMDEAARPFDEVAVFREGSSLTQGHFGPLRSLAAVPVSGTAPEDENGDGSSISPVAGPLFVTAGLDGQLCVFDTEAANGVQKTHMKKLQFTSVYWTKHQRILLGTRLGECLILSQRNLALEELYHAKVAESAINCLTETPDEEFVLLGSQDGILYILQYRRANFNNPKDTWEAVALDSGFAPIESIQLPRFKSIMEPWLAWIVNKNGDHIICNVNQRTLIKGVTEYRSMEWDLSQALLTPDIKGIWGTNFAKDDRVLSVSVSEQPPLAVAGTEKGKLGLFKYPCSSHKVFCHTLSCSVPITKVLLLGEHSKIITVGGDDACILQWNLV